MPSSPLLDRVRRGTIGRSDDTAEDGPDPVRVVRAILAGSDIEILFDGSVRKRSAPRMAMSQADVEACLSSEGIDAQWLVDEILLDLRSRGIKLRTSEVEELHLSTRHRLGSIHSLRPLPHPGGPHPFGFRAVLPLRYAPRENTSR